MYKDNAERAMFFARGSLETVKKLRWTPQIVHCVGVMSAFAPYLLKLAYYEEPSYKESRIVFTLSLDAPDSPLPKNFDGIISYREADKSALKTLGSINNFSDLNRIGMFMSDAVVLTEPNEHYERMAREMGKPYVIMTQDNYTSSTLNIYDILWDEVVRNRPKEEEDDGFLF